MSDILRLQLPAGFSFAGDEPSGPLGIRSVTQHRDGRLVATLGSGAEVPVTLPSGWRCQVMPGLVVWQHDCGALVMGSPMCGACGG